MKCVKQKSSAPKRRVAINRVFEEQNSFGSVLQQKKEIYEENLQLERLNYAHVVLIPKKMKTAGVGDYKPISVLDISIKITSKVLA